MSGWSLTHGTHGLLLAYVLTLVPLVAVLVQRRVPARGLFLAPFVAIPAAVVGMLVGQVLIAVVPASAATAPWTALLVGIAAFLFVGYAAGLLLTRQQRLAADTHKRGTLVMPASARRAGTPGSVTLAGVEVPLLDETKHFKIIGTTGTAKSTAIAELLQGALARGTARSSRTRTVGISSASTTKTAGM